METHISVDTQTLWDNTKRDIVSRGFGHKQHQTEEGILDTIVALGVHGIHAIQSCEGHIKHDSIFPFVIFESSKETDINPETEIEYKKIIESIERDVQSMCTKLQSLLDEFYSGKEYNPYHYEITELHKNRKYMLVPNGVVKTTQKQEAEYKKITLEESRKKLAEFTEFLKAKYFGN
ncbi:MAG: hypothetical protein WCO65_02060 [bacterium]